MEFLLKIWLKIELLNLEWSSKIGLIFKKEIKTKCYPWEEIENWNRI